MSKRGGLGRGLGALIPTQAEAPAPPSADGVVVDDRAPASGNGSGDGGSSAAPPVASTGPSFVNADAGPIEVAGAVFREIPLADVSPNARQPRQVFDEDQLAELTHSIREFGLLQPIVVREVEGSGYELVMGERRWRAAQAAELDVIPAIVRHTADESMLRDALLENIHRVQLNPLEEAAAYEQLLAEFGVTHEELANRLGRSRSQVSNTIRLLKLPVRVQHRVAAGVLSAGHARALLALDDSERQEQLAARIVAEGLSVRATEEAIAMASSEPTATKRAPGRKLNAPGVEDLSERMSDVFDTKVSVQLGRKKGKIVVEFGSVADLERIVALMAPEVASGLPAAASTSDSD